MNTISTWIAVHRKAITSLVAGVLGWGTIVQSTGIDAHAWWALAAIVAGAFGVSGMTNDAPRQNPPPPDAGYADVVSLVVVVVLLLILCRIFGLL